MRATILAVLGLLASPVWSEAVIPLYEAQYQAQYKGRNSGISVFSVAHDTDRDLYTFESHTQVKGLLRLASPRPVIEHSEFGLQNGQLRPLTFRFEDGTRKGEDNYVAHFDWSAGEVALHGEAGTRTLTLEPGVLDRGSLQVAIMRDVAAGRVPGPYVLADEDSLKTYEFSFEDDAEIDTPLGNFTARRLKQQRRGSSRHTVIWMVPELRHVPVLIEQYRDGEVRSAFVLEALEWH